MYFTIWSEPVKEAAGKRCVSFLQRKTLHCYRPQTKFAKVMFLQVSVCPRGEGWVSVSVQGGSPSRGGSVRETPWAETPQTDPRTETAPWTETPLRQRPPGRQVPIFSYFFLFFSAYSYFSYFLAISSYFSYFLAILLTISKYLLEI